MRDKCITHPCQPRFCDDPAFPGDPGAGLCIISIVLFFLLSPTPGCSCRNQPVALVLLTAQRREHHPPSRQ
jgi:hypothetical protein